MVYVGRDFTPAQQTENREYGMDFVNDISEDEVLTAATWVMTVRRGVDPDPGSHLVGGPSLTTPKGTTAQTATMQRIAGVLPNVVYTVDVTVTTDKGNTVSNFTHLAGEPVE